jgi:serine phosphatase RsbU (regulator of sigma subunit)
MALILIFLVIYVFNRRKAAKRLHVAHTKLEEAHTKLKSAYDQLEVTTKAKERIESELRIARDIQKSMVPSTFPKHAGMDIYASMHPAKEVGGDLYSYLLQGDELYFCVGDVSGKGVPASLFMAQATRLFSTLAAQHMMPAEIATRMNNALTENNEQGMFITMFMGLLDFKRGRLTFCNAGHNPPVLGVDGHDHFMNMEPNAPLGLWSDIDYVGETIDNIKGKLLLVYTDGLNEAENRQQQQFGDDRLLDILNHHHFNSARHAIEYLEEEIEKHRDGAEPNDDLTMLCIFT